MSIAENKISGRQFMFTITCIIQASALLNAFISNVTQQETWLIVLFGTLVFLPTLWMYRCLIVRFPDKNLVEITIHIFGPILGRVISFFYIFFFFVLLCLNSVDMTTLCNSTMLPNTPIYVLLAICLLVAAWAVRSGLRVMTLYGKFFVIASFIIIIGSIVLLIGKFEFNNLFPVFDMPLIKYIQGIHILNTIPFGELVVILMISPNVVMTKKETTKYLFIGTLLGAVSFLLTVLRDILALGGTFGIFMTPSLMAFRLIRFAEVFTRSEILFVCIFIVLLFFKITVLFYACVTTITQVFNLEKYKPLVFPLGLLVMVASLVFMANPVHHIVSGRQAAPFLWMIPEIILPTITLFVAILFKKKSERSFVT